MTPISIWTLTKIACWIALLYSSLVFVVTAYSAWYVDSHPARKALTRFKEAQGGYTTVYQWRRWLFFTLLLAFSQACLYGLIDFTKGVT